MENPPEFNEDDFFEDEQEQPMEDISQGEFEALCNNVFEMDLEIQAEAAALKERKKTHDKLKSKVLFLMQKYKKQNTTCENGMLMQVETTSVKLPQDEDKKLFFAYLKEKGIFEDVVHMNSKTFNSFYKAERDAALEDGDIDWKMPGVGDEVVGHQLRMRRKKK